ncbi:MAG: hypothetical protein QXZ44_05285, partial [Ferroplasma sp.]
MLLLYILLPASIVGLSILIAALHMVAPDHWTPILAYAARNKIKTRKTGIISFSLGLIHGIFSAVISLLIVIIGITFFPDFYVKILTVGILVAVVIYIVANANLEERKKPDNAINKSILLVSVIPDPAIVPIILIAVIYGMHFVYFTISLFIVTSAVMLLITTIFLSKFMLKRIATFTPKKIDYLVAIVLIATMFFVFL